MSEYESYWLTLGPAKDLVWYTSQLLKKYKRPRLHIMEPYHMEGLFTQSSAPTEQSPWYPILVNLLIRITVPRSSREKKTR